MATAYKILGQSAPSANTVTTLYTCPSSPSTQTIISTIAICNRATFDSTYRISVRPSGESLANKHYVVYDSEVLANDTITLTLGITMSPGSILEVSANTANLSFSCFGSEIT